MEYIRVSASYLFNLEIDGKYLLIKSERRNQYQPIGGCYKYFPEAEGFLNSIGAIPEKKSNGKDSLMDLRLLLPKAKIEEFKSWYESGAGREVSYDREFNEELVSVLSRDKQAVFDKVKFSKQKSGAFELYFDEEKQIESIKPMDIVYASLTDEQKQILKNELARGQSNLILVSYEDIASGYVTMNNTKHKIGSHTKNILLPIEETLEG